MYLRSLTLRGFKSFADKTQLVFDPGLSVIVGPNGSGKSNISDAILWVLGEQSAKMLRGQAMEDVIFSGSTARQGVGVAEVTLVLDNSDRTLPIDFAEIGITRRMFRSGESDYLINGAPSRLMDVRDILHDSGLGRETHSIISQGKLDLVLSSRPQDRRDLIEEAADISKHRRRKERSERKLASMDENLAKAKVVSREVARQLKPLERQVERAREVHELKEELKELTTVLAVCDLRRLKDAHEQLLAQERQADAAINLAQWCLDERTTSLEKLQSLLEEKGLFVGDLDRERQRMSSVLSVMDADLRLLDEKSRNMSARLGDLDNQLVSDKAQVKRLTSDQVRLEGDLLDIQAAQGELRSRLDAAQLASDEAARRKNDLDDEIAKLESDLRSARSLADSETLAYARLEDQVSSADIADAMFASRLSQLAESSATDAEALKRRRDEARELADELEVAKAASESLAQSIARCAADSEDAREAEVAASSRLSEAQATLTALRSVDFEIDSSNPRVVKLVSQDAECIVCRLSDLIETDAETGALVEQLLGDDLGALVATDAQSASILAKSSLRDSAVQGRATILSLDTVTTESSCEAPGTPLLDQLHMSEKAQPMLMSLLGDIRIVEDVDAAIYAHQEWPNLTFVTIDGAAVLADGRIHIGTTPTSQTGALDRKHRIRALEEGMSCLQVEAETSHEAAESARRALAETQASLATTKGDIARLTSLLTSAKEDIGRLESQVERCESERTQVERRREEAQSKASEARDLISSHRDAAKLASCRADKAQSAIDLLASDRQEATSALDGALSALAEARLAMATSTERHAGLSARLTETRKTLDELKRRVASAETARSDLKALCARVPSLRVTYEAARDRALAWDSRLKDRATLAEADSDSLKKTIGDARAAVAEATSDLDAARSAATEARVEVGKLEVQVQSAVASIEATGAILEEALELPSPSDRSACEIRAADLRRRIEAIGPVNEVAIEEYQDLKDRHDYLFDQIADLESARKALMRIISAIDRKMKARFSLVFEKVNRNFGEVFALLFPGGHAALELTDPDNLSETGIEVVAQPKGKRLTKMTLMSGGERSLTALALLFAVYRVRTVPFYVFDEVEAALDDSNLSKFLDAVEQLKETTQLIVITHQRRTMEQADVLYGVSMQADGVSRVVSQRLDRASGKVVDA